MSSCLRSGNVSRISARLIRSANIPTTVATGMRRPLMQGTPPIWRGSTVMRLNLVTAPLNLVKRKQPIWQPWGQPYRFFDGGLFDRLLQISRSHPRHCQATGSSHTCVLKSQKPASKKRASTLTSSTTPLTAPHMTVTEQVRFLKTILDSSTEYSIVARNLRGTIVAWNEGARRIQGGYLT
jgi:hypothetical protein